MPYADAKYPAKLRPADPGMLAALCEARDAFAAMDWDGDENWRHWDAVEVDQLISGTLHVVDEAISKAQGGDAWDASMVGQTPR